MKKEVELNWEKKRGSNNRKTFRDLFLFISGTLRTQKLGEVASGVPKFSSLNYTQRKIFFGAYYRTLIEVQSGWRENVGTKYLKTSMLDTSRKTAFAQCRSQGGSRSQENEAGWPDDRTFDLSLYSQLMR